MEGDRQERSTLLAGTQRPYWIPGGIGPGTPTSDKVETHPPPHSPPASGEAGGKTGATGIAGQLLVEAIAYALER